MQSIVGIINKCNETRLGDLLGQCGIFLKTMNRQSIMLPKTCNQQRIILFEHPGHRRRRLAGRRRRRQAALQVRVERGAPVRHPLPTEDAPQPRGDEAGGVPGVGGERRVLSHSGAIVTALFGFQISTRHSSIIFPKAFFQEKVFLETLQSTRT